MSQISETFSRLSSMGERALIPYLTAGYPTKAHTLPLLRALEAGGADIIEIGVPFSDPVADGPTIQQSSYVALQQGVNVRWILQAVREFRQGGSTTPIILFGAVNPFLHYGIDDFARDARDAGVNAVLIPDVPAEEAPDVLPVFTKYGLDVIWLVAPTSTPERIKLICSNATGFIYYISVKGVTGARSNMSFDLDERINFLRECTKLPIAVGFGISTPEQAATLGKAADGIVVGSALIDLITNNAENPRLLELVQAYMASLKAPLARSPAAAPVSQ